MPEISAVGLVVLAAGGSTRLGQPKQLLIFEGRSLLSRACQTALASLCCPIVAILGYEAALLRQEIEDEPLQIIENAAWREGIGTSICAGVQHLMSQDVSALILMVCDQPLLKAQHLNDLIHLYQTSGKGIVASCYADTFGVPVLFSRAFFPDLLNLPPDVGAKKLLMQNRKSMASVLFSQGVIDVDTMKDYENLKRDNALKNL